MNNRNDGLNLGPSGWQAREIALALCVAALTAACGRTNLQLVSTNESGSTAGGTNSGVGATGGTSATLSGTTATVGGTSTTGTTGRATSAGVGGAGSGTTGGPNLPTFDCGAVASQQFDAATMEPYSVSEDVQRRVDAALEQMSPAAKHTQMMGVDGSQRNYRDIQRSPDVQVPGVGAIRGYRYRDGGRGVNLDAGQDNRVDGSENFATAFPAPSLRAASWDLALERRVGSAIGDETAASRNNILTAPCINIVRHPYWGRAQECYGEDTYHVGRMATAFTVGVQEYVAACARAFAANNIERQRAAQNAVLDEQTLREIYGRDLEMVVQDAGVSCVVAALNAVNDVKSTQNPHLLRDLLKAPVEQGGMGFEGFVLSDWWAMPGGQDTQDPSTAQNVTNEAVSAGTDVEMPWTLHYNAATLANVDQQLVGEAARRILTQKFRFGSALDSDPWSLTPPSSTLTDSGSIATNAAHEALAEEAAIESAVLLTNGLDAGAPVLPLINVTTLAVVGPDQEFSLISSSVPKSCMADSDNARTCTFHFATDAALGDRGSSRVNADPERSVGPFQGIQEIAGARRTVTSGSSAEAAADADAVVVVVGYTPGDEGEEYTTREGGDRSTLDLPEGQVEFVMSVLDLDKPTVVIVESGSVVKLPWLVHPNPRVATIWAGYPGARGGLALGKLIFGRANFSGKMPMAWPTEEQLSPFKDSDTQTTMGYFFGYREYDRRRYVDGAAAALVFPFGHGLSYSTFEYSNLNLPCQTVTKDAVFNVAVDITNTSDVDGDEVVMLFIKPPPKPTGITGERPWKELKSFVRVSVAAGQKVTAVLPLRIRDLRRWEGDANGRWVIDSGDYTVLVGKNAEDAELTDNVATFTVNGD